MALSQLHRDRITKLRDTLLLIPRERFDINVWGRRDMCVPLDRFEGNEMGKASGQLECGFAGCVYGHFPTAFWAEGWRWSQGGVPYLGESYEDTAAQFKSHDPVTHMASFLGLTYEQADYVAAPEAYYGKVPKDADGDWADNVTPEVAAGHLTQILEADAAGNELPTGQSDSGDWL
jgi:hypothetical protein